MDAPGPGGLGGTFAGNPLSCAAALAVLDLFEKENLLAAPTNSATASSAAPANGSAAGRSSATCAASAACRRSNW
jgi:adenosylmethionine-8-amino-7-oxononanoate aminotransferase